MTAIERFIAKAKYREDGCMEWTAARSAKGYGQFWDGRQMIHAHRWLYQHRIGPVPDGLELDHLCRNRWCVDPDHLEPVDHATNLSRGNGVGVRNAAKTACPQGHPYDMVDERGRRRCSVCRRAQDRHRGSQ